MGVLASHVPSIEQLKPGLVEVIEESGGSKQFFCTFSSIYWEKRGKEVMGRGKNQFKPDDKDMKRCNG